MSRCLRLLALSLGLGLGGCAPTPEQPEERALFSFRTASTPYTAAICIGRNAKVRPGVAAEERLLGDTGMEVIVRPGGGSADTLAVARVLRDGLFSKVSIQVSRLVAADRDGFARALMAGC